MRAVGRGVCGVCVVAVALQKQQARCVHRPVPARAGKNTAGRQKGEGCGRGDGEGGMAVGGKVCGRDNALY